MTPANDWDIKRLLAVSLGILLAFWVLAWLDIPVLRQLVGFVFLTLAPGLLILRIFKIHNINIVESLLYAVGLSLAFVMAMGVAANFALPPLGISKPITLLPLLLVITPGFLLLCLLAYIRDKGFRPSGQSYNRAPEPAGQSFPANAAPYLLAVLLPLLAILGASLVNSYCNNTLLFVFIFVIVIIIGLAAFNKFIHPRIYPVMIFTMALALLYQTTFISDYLVGSDIHLECYLGKLVVSDGYWDATTPSLVNSCLSVTVLSPAYSVLLNMDIAWLFKIVYPLLFALVPLALFRIFRLQIKPKYAFLAAFFFIAMPMFTMDMAQLARQQISELFFVLVILLLVDRRLTMLQRATFVIIFGFGVIVSYYGLGTGYTIGYLACGAVVLIVIKSRFGQKIWRMLIGKSNALPDDLASAGALNKKVLFPIVIVTLAFMFIYYNVVASGAGSSGTQVAAGIARVTSEQVIKGITMPPPVLPPTTGEPSTGEPSTEPSEAAIKRPGFVQDLLIRFPFLNPLSKEPLTQTALGLDFPTASPGGKVWRILQYLVELCLIVGFFRLVFRPATFGKLRAEYIAMIIVSIVILAGIFFLPTWSYGLGTARIWQITLLVTAPLFIFGGETIGSGVLKLVNMATSKLHSQHLSSTGPVPLQALVLVVLMPYFIFNSGAVFELSRSQTTHFIDMPYSIALSSCRVDLNTVFTEQDVVAADWLCAVSNHRLNADIHGCQLFYNYQQTQNAGELASSSCIYLRTWNARNKVWTVGTAYAARQSISFDDLPWLSTTIEEGDRIYNNGSAQVLLSD